MNGLLINAPTRKKIKEKSQFVPGKNNQRENERKEFQDVRPFNSKTIICERKRFLKLAETDGGALSEGNHSLFLYKYPRSDTYFVRKIYSIDKESSRNKILNEININQHLLVNKSSCCPEFLGYDIEESYCFLNFRRFGENLETVFKNSEQQMKSNIKNVLALFLKCMIDLHQNGIIHRDIHIKNLLYNPEIERASICDFEYAIYENENKYKKKEDVGIDLYRAPEISQKGVSFASDLFALGMSFLILLQSGNPVKIFYEETCHKRIEELAISADLKTVLKTMTKWNPEERKTAEQCLKMMEGHPAELAL